MLSTILRRNLAPVKETDQLQIRVNSLQMISLVECQWKVFHCLAFIAPVILCSMGGNEGRSLDLQYWARYINLKNDIQVMENWFQMCWSEAT